MRAEAAGHHPPARWACAWRRRARHRPRLQPAIGDRRAWSKASPISWATKSPSERRAARSVPPLSARTQRRPRTVPATVEVDGGSPAPADRSCGSRLSSTWAQLGRLAAPPCGDVRHLQVSPRAGGRSWAGKRASARDLEDARPEALTMVTPPGGWRHQARRAERESSSEFQRVHEAASRRRHSTLSGRRPSTVRTMTLPFTTVGPRPRAAGGRGSGRYRPAHSSFVQRAGGEDGDAGRCVGETQRRRGDRGRSRASRWTFWRRWRSGKRAAGGDAVLQRKAGAGWRLGAVAEHPPAAVRTAAEFEGDEMQEAAAAAAATPTIGRRNSGLTATSCGGTVALGDQPVVAVDVGEHGSIRSARWTRPAAMPCHSASSMMQRHVG